MTAPGGVIATVYVNVLPRIKEFATDLRKQLRASQRDLRALDRELKPVERGFIRIGKVATGIVPGVKLATLSLQAIGGKAIVGGLIAAAGAATTMAGALIALPAAGVAAASVMGALAIGTRGVQDALKKFDDPEKFAEKLELLSKNGQKTLRVLEQMRGRIDAFRNAVQDQLFAGMDVVLRNLINTLLPRAQQHFTNLTKTINAGAKELAAFVSSDATLGDIDEITSNTEHAFRSLVQAALIPAATAFRDIATVGSRSLLFLVDHVVRLVRQFQQFIAVARATGQLQTWMENGIAAVLQFARILGNVGRGIGAILDEARASGNGLLDVLEKVTDNIADFLQSRTGRNFIRQFLDSAREAAEAIIPVLIALADLLFLHVLPVLERFAKAVGPAVEQFFYGLGDALDIAAPGIEAFARGFASFISAIVPALPAVGALVGAIGQFIGILATEAGPAVADIVATLSHVLIPVVQLLTGVIDALGPSFLKIVAVIGAVVIVLGTLTTIMRGVETVTGLFAGGLKTLTGGLQKTEGGVRGVLSFLSGPWGLVIGAATLALGLFLSTTEDAGTKQREFAQAAQDLNDAIREQNGIINENVRIKAAEQLDQAGALELAKQLGISTRQVTDAYLHQGDALKEVRSQLQGNISALQEEHDRFKSVRGGRARADAIASEIAANQRLLDIINGLVGERDADTDATNRQAEASRTGANSLTFFADALNLVRTAQELVNAEQQRQQDLQLAATNSQLSYQKTLLRTKDTLSEFNGTMDINNAESADAIGALAELAAAGQRRVKDLQAQNASTKVINQAIKDNQNVILGLLEPFFKSREAARKFAEQIGLIPRAPTVTPKFNDSAARAKAGAFAAYLDYVARDRVATIRFNSRGNAQAAAGIPTGGFDIATNALGGYLPAGRWSWVGERGPELVRFSRSARVFSNQDSMSMTRDVDALDAMTSYGGTGAGATTRAATTGASKLEATVNVQTTPEVRVYIDGREVRAIVKTELDERDRKLVQLVDIGVGRRT